MPNRKGAKAVYALVDPRNEEVFYVGASYRPELRWEQHCKRLGGGGPPNERIAELESLGKSPQLRILAPADDDWRAKEHSWQHHYRETILNVSRKESAALDVRPAIAEALRAIRADSGLTREAVAESVSCNPSTVYRWENNMRTPNVNDLAALSMTYGVEPSSFFPDKETLAQAIKSISTGPRKDPE